MSETNVLCTNCVVIDIILIVTDAVSVSVTVVEGIMMMITVMIVMMMLQCDDNDHNCKR